MHRLYIVVALAALAGCASAPTCSLTPRKLEHSWLLSSPTCRPPSRAARRALCTAFEPGDFLAASRVSIGGGDIVVYLRPSLGCEEVLR